jgi:hypothetical protein
MSQTYQAILKGGQLEWVGDAPEYDRNLPLNVQVVVSSASLPSNEPSRGQKMAAILAELANRGAVSEIKDPVAWQREIRKDRPLPEREGE